MTIDLQESLSLEFNKFPKAKYELLFNLESRYVCFTTRRTEVEVVYLILGMFPQYKSGPTKIIKKDASGEKVVYEVKVAKKYRKVISLHNTICYNSALEASRCLFISHAAISKHCDPFSTIKNIMFMYEDDFKTKYPDRIPFIKYYEENKITNQ